MGYKIVKLEPIKKKENSLSIIPSLILLGITLCFTILIFLYTEMITNVLLDERFMEFLFTASLTAMGIGLFALQIKGETIYEFELKKDLLDSSIWMITSFFIGILFLIEPEYQVLNLIGVGKLSIFFFMWGLILFFTTIVFVRIGAYQYLVEKLSLKKR